jgi:hypothetical protein
MQSPIRLSASRVPLQPAPVLGADTDDVLQTELGLSHAELAELHARRVAVDGRPSREGAPAPA